MANFNRLLGKVALVTGGGSGIGREICQVFAREGASVAVLDTRREKCLETLTMLPKEHGNTHCVIQADVRKIDDVKLAITAAKDGLGKPCNVLVNNAGIVIGSPFTASTEKDFNAVIAVNLNGVYLMAREFIKSLQDSNDEVRGCIVNVSSLAGKIGFPDNAAYSASKAGVLGLNKTIALEFQKHRIRCNAVLPGFTDTPMLDVVDKTDLENLVRAVPMQRVGRPEEIANVCLFLASDESSYVHGSCLEVGGGLRW